jgi:hypothetical protein
MYTDPILDEIRKFRDDYAARFNYDVKALLEDVRSRQNESGRKTVLRAPKRIAKSKTPASDCATSG